MDELAQGTKIERYIVEELLGEGGMAAVYRVRHETLGTNHALKVLTVGGKKIRKRLVQEGRVQAMLNHPNVVAVRDVLDVDGSPGLLMDFVDGPDLEAWIQTEQPDQEAATEVFRQIVLAVQAAHKQGLVHRDLKPANVLMRQLGDGSWQAKVADFGLAKALEDGKDALSLTRQGATLGTPAYMAPEQIRDASSVDHRADIWALGCIYYQLLTGEPPFGGLDIVEVFNQVTSGEFITPSTIRPNLPVEADETVVACLQIDRDQRLMSCDAVLASLDGYEGPGTAASTWEGAPRIEPRPDEGPWSVAPEASPAIPQTALAGTLPEESSEPPADELDPADRIPATLPSPGPTPYAWAIPIVMAIVIGGGSLALVAGVAWTAGTVGGAAFGCSGWVRGPTVFLKGGTGTEWRVPDDREVVTSLPSEGSDWEPGRTACTLPAGTTITLVEDPVRLGRAGIWFRVYPSNTAAPPTE